jgi:hypothetical protein
VDWWSVGTRAQLSRFVNLLWVCFMTNGQYRLSIRTLCDVVMRIVADEIRAIQNGEKGE